MKDNQEGYDRWASFYDSYPNPTVAIDELQFPQTWTHLRNKRVLEIGCGTGRHTQKLVAQGNAVTAVDASIEMLRQAQAKISDPSVEWMHGDFMEMTFESAAFDAVVLALVLEHIQDLESFSGKVASILKPGGQAFISDIHPSRTKQGVFAHFKDPQNGVDVQLTSFEHREEHVRSVALQCGLEMKVNQDVVGSNALSALRPQWEKYRGTPMLKIYVLQKRG